jgi:demethylmenaquinone methyltransferase/2-methoxy-6-polyprenyl-1,4-benzoquinol methylase/phosphoethanolamine N-methyltransferase
MPKAKAFIPAARFHALTPVYDRLCRLLGLGAGLRRFEMGLLEGLQPWAVLEVGCGTGELLAAVAKRFPKAALVGVDPDTAALRRARAKLERFGKRVRFFTERAEALPFPRGSFDLVLSSLMLHHLPAEAKVRAMREWHRVLAPEGVLILVDFGRPDSWWLRALSWPLRPFEHVADNLRGATPGILTEAGFRHGLAGRFGGLIFAYQARPSPSAAPGARGGGAFPAESGGAHAARASASAPVPGGR